ncbi:BRCA1 C Terminus (BRCT) domain containing protein [Coccidioides posadasii C735 delta SOWgp]|uniref:BRCA1 C Terminus (BRCT) domain containing protein n=1 Tax=Coccidioides posadasii (strain C735) TaxID=222929 RepID=C5PDI6_COCP7|nr:BRCA1 C Terminus (BRCT) domain containing protein [Coccidioides posadasii C735 delta SOWgp]EER25147.1 BRCA1 C Terminus (BRCT) domain containing protein [Coccidioides posadasii C735 delta SOWgp]|eukprot:XP_003067292.1 BRCA1 C Terminus (BRCT) domain containing protein [Coccidioides posadasii C735 delta SOWgp]
MAEDVAPNKEQPLRGVILCCTSILPETRSQLAAIAGQMGAVHMFDLTSDVTHLIVGETNTPKYKYVAKERSDVKVLRPEWIEAVRSSWLLGGDTDLHALEEEYKLPTFAGLSICLTGFEDLNFRNHLQRTIAKNGGEFRRDLTKSVTHLIARSAEGQKYKFGVLWNIKIVGLRWLEDSLERGMVLDESLYDPLVPEEEQGIGAWNRTAPIQVEKRQNVAEVAFQRPRKLRRVTSVKLGDQNEGIWTEIMGNNSAGGNEQGVYDGSADATPKPRASAIIQETKSFASETTLPERRNSVAQDALAPRFQPAEKALGIWYGAQFFISGFTTKQTQLLRDHLISRDAEIVSSIDDLSIGDGGPDPKQYILVPYNLPQSDIPSTADSESEAHVVTDMWIEKCIHSNTFVPPEAHITSTPVPRFPIPAFQSLRVCSTGFTGIDLLHVSKLVTLLGATYDEYFTQKASVLICNTTKPNSEKLRHAHQWNIPAVLADWLWISVQTGEMKAFEPYLISGRDPYSAGGQTNEIRSLGGSRQTEPKKLQGPSGQQPESRKQDEGSSKEEPILAHDASLEPGSHGSPAKKMPSPPPTLELSKADSSEDKPATSSRSLDVAISELLRQTRSRAKQSAEKSANTQRRRQLFGRANSNSSLLGNKERISRASSIDTLNEDGYGSVVDGFNSPSVKGHSKAPSFTSLAQPTAALKGNSDPTEAQQLLESRLNLLRNGLGQYDAERYEFEEEETPPMTQLGYEAPDAVAMREKITRRAREMNGAEENTDDRQEGKNKNDNGGRLVIGQLKDSETLAIWGGGRRTRSKRTSNGDEI